MKRKKKYHLPPTLNEDQAAKAKETLAKAMARRRLEELDRQLEILKMRRMAKTQRLAKGR